MGKHNWTDENIEDILRRMPSVNDTRNPNDVYLNISRKLKKKRQVAWIFPAFASATAILLFFILLPNLSNLSNSIGDFAQEAKLTEQTQDKNLVENDTDSLKIPKEEKKQESTLYTGIEMEKTAVYAEDLAGKELLTYAIPDNNAQNIASISVLVNKDESKHWFQQFVDTMPMLTEAGWGLSEFYPLNGVLTYNSDQKSVNVDLPADHQYGMGSANEVMFQKALIAVFNNRNDVNTITFSTAHNPGVRLGNDEIFKFDLKTNEGKAHPYLLLHVKENDKPLLVPTQEPITSLDEAFKTMRSEITTQGLHASIPEELKFDEVTSNKDTVTIFISKDSKISQTPEMVYALESILLTIKEFGFSKLEIKNSDMTTIDPFRLDRGIDVPVAANKKEYYRKGCCLNGVSTF